MRVATKETKVYTYEELSEEGKEKACKRYNDININGDWWDYDEKLDIDSTIIDEGNKIFFDIDRTQYLQFPDIKIKDKKAFLTKLKIPLRLQAELDIDFIHATYGGSSAANTALELDWQGNHDLPRKYQDILDDAIELFDDIINNSLFALRRQYEYLTLEEAIAETLIINEYEFDENGKIYYNKGV